MKRRRKKRYLLVPVLLGMVIASVLITGGNRLVVKTSENEFCASCHIHPQATETWKRSTHYDNQRGIQVACVDCHLPPKGEGYLIEKTKTGLRDVWGMVLKDPESFNWDARSQVEYAKRHVYESSCIDCHNNNFPIGLSPEGREAHLYYEQKEGAVGCINCHITTGHYDPERQHAQNLEFGKKALPVTEIYSEPGKIDGFSDFTEYIPGTGVSFTMRAIPGGTFRMGSPAGEPFRNADEGPVVEVTVSPFFMGQAEVTWDEYLAFFNQTGVEGKTSDAYLKQDLPSGVDAISGPTPPYGAPDQGWGTGRMPAITMTHHAATVYCEWLSKVTGKLYRLPTEAEWEYAARGGTSTPYFFEGSPKDYAGQGLWKRLFGPDTSVINSYVCYAENSQARPEVPGSKRENPFGLEHMPGNVAEFCSDWYAEETYETYAGKPVRNPRGPEGGKEFVIRGGSFRDDAAMVRSAARDHTRSDDWLKTDPQIPKSIWWYSDCYHVGFRVVCETTDSGAQRNE